MSRHLILIALISTVLSGCQSLPQAETTHQPPVDTASTYSSSGSAQAVQGSTVIALLDTANRQAAAGDNSSARRTLERALRIEPRNAHLWNELARLYYQDRQYIKAANTAAKSNSLAGANPALKRNNWTLIANARRQTGDEAGAIIADEKAQTYD